MQNGKIKTKITDKQLQELAMEVLVAKTRFSQEFKSLLKPTLIQGIINAERTLWGINDDFPSIPDAWGRALFAMGLPVRGIAEMDDAGWVAAGGVGVGAAGGVGVGAAVAILFIQPVGWAILAGAGLGIALVEGVYAIGAIVIGDLNSTVGRGQIDQKTWDRAAEVYGKYFKDYLDKVMQTIELKKQMQTQLEAYKLNDISVKYNLMDKKNVKVLENFMIAAVLLKKCERAAERINQGRSPSDALKYGIAAYHGIPMNKINSDLDRYGALEFPSEAEFVSLGKQKDYSYVMEVLE